MMLTGTTYTVSLSDKTVTGVDSQIKVLVIQISMMMVSGFAFST